jgi:hypothetical protein
MNLLSKGTQYQMSNAPIIGELRGTTTNVPRTDTQPQEPEKTKEEELTPAEAYEKLLTDNNITLSHARSVIDRVITNGFYEEKFSVVGKTGFFKTRVYSDQLRINLALEMENPKLPITQSDLIIRHNLAASLVEWAGKSYRSVDFYQKLKTLEEFPTPVINILSRELSKFDTKIMIIFSDGAIDSF